MNAISWNWRGKRTRKWKEEDRTEREGKEEEIERRGDKKEWGGDKKEWWGKKKKKKKRWEEVSQSGNKLLIHKQTRAHLFGFYGILTFVGYLMTNPFFLYI